MANLDHIVNENQIKGNLLIVDDEKPFLMVLERIFQRYFIVKSATSGDKALEILKKGFNPGVILSDQRMPGMTGAEFLEQSISLVPDAVRIILTGFDNPRDIIPCINKAHAYMYLTKPCEEIELIQAVRIGFDYYHGKLRNQELVQKLNDHISEVNDKTERYKKLYTDNKSLFTQMIQSLSGLLSLHESYYFNSHSTYVTTISKSIAEEMKLPGELTIILFSALMHNITYLGMPKKFLLVDPYDLDAKEQKSYFDYLAKSINNLFKVDVLKKYATIISQIWEHNDGSGLPKGLAVNEVMKESQIVALANIYHNMVYRLPLDKLEIYEKTGQVVQTAKETLERHNEAIKFLYKKANWFDVEIFNTFHDLAKRRNCSALVPDTQDLKLVSKDLEHAGFIFSDVTEQVVDIKDSDEINIDFSNLGTDKMKEVDIPVDKIESGMIIAQNLITKNGHLIVRQETALDGNLVKNIKQLESSGMIKGPITVLIKE